MTEPTSTNGETSGHASVPWSYLWPDLTLIAAGILVMVVSFIIDIYARHHDYFSRSGAIAALMSGILAYRSLTKHYEKFFIYPQRQKILRTSRNQLIVDRCTLALSILGTLVWGYGDKLF